MALVDAAVHTAERKAPQLGKRLCSESIVETGSRLLVSAEILGRGQIETTSDRIVIAESGIGLSSMASACSLGASDGSRGTGVSLTTEQQSCSKDDEVFPDVRGKSTMAEQTGGGELQRW